MGSFTGCVIVLSLIWQRVLKMIRQRKYVGKKWGVDVDGKSGVAEWNDDDRLQREVGDGGPGDVMCVRGARQREV